MTPNGIASMSICRSLIPLKPHENIQMQLLNASRCAFCTAGTHFEQHGAAQPVSAGAAVALLSYLLKAIKPWLYSIKIIWIETHGIATILGN